MDPPLLGTSDCSSSKKSAPTKRTIQWIEQQLDNGSLETKTVKRGKYDSDDSPALLHYTYSDGSKFDYVSCTHCLSVLSARPGGHWLKHQKRTCLSNVSTSALKESEDKVRDAITSYCTTSGTSFRHTESEAFRSMLRKCMGAVNPSINPDSINLPCRQTVRDATEKKCIGIVEEIGVKIREQIKTKKATIVLDFGLHIFNFLSVFISFVEFSDNGAPSLRILPYCFSPMFVIKSAENVRDELIKCGARFGLSAKEILSMQVVSDGAANLASMGKRFFADWALCSCHALQKISEKVLSPTVRLHWMYSEEELNALKECDELLKKCAKLSLLVHKRKRDVRITKLPSVYIDTRWQSLIKCAKDVQRLLPILTQSKVSEVADLSSDIESEATLLNNCIECLERFEPLILLFEESSIHIHLYLPLVHELHDQFSQMEHETDDKATQILNKSGRVITGQYLENSISDIHLKATLLSPQLKKMSKLPLQIKEKARNAMKEAIVTMTDEISAENKNSAETSKTTKPQKRFAFLFDDVEDTGDKDELECYLAEKVTAATPECPLRYWFTKKDEYPILFKIALHTFSALPSETVCERAFSAVKRVIRDDRHRLDPEMIENMMIAYFYENNYS